ncbi:MAG: Ig-like domain-containing protein [Chloroflexi bacterium]|nr:Ig-like domain-containing protein [Chloroflexota bacterium]
MGVPKKKIWRSNMSANSSQKLKPQRRIWLFVLILLLLFVLVGLWLYTGRSVQTRDPSPAVTISKPVTGDVLELGRPFMVTAKGFDPLGVTRLELYVNGTLTAVQKNTVPERYYLEGFDDAWMPTSAGRYMLMIRGYRSDGRFADSRIVLVDVVVPAAFITGTLVDILPASTDRPCPSLNQLATMLGISIEDLLTLNPGLVGTDADLPLDCKANISLPRPITPPPGIDGGTSAGTGDTGGDTGTPPETNTDTGIPPAFQPGSPTQPAWVAVDPSACTSVLLTWTGSPDAEGYTLYRNAPGDTFMNSVAHLPASQTTYTDTITLAGGYIYQVAAVSAELEALSVTFSFNTGDTPACASLLRSTEPPAGSSLYLIVPSLQTDTIFEGVYCYLSVDGGAQGRLPEADFSSLFPLKDGLSYDLRTPPSRGHYLLTRTGSDPVTLEMRCMGRQGAFSDSLGGFLVSVPSSKWYGRELKSRSTGGTGSFTVHSCITSDPTQVDCISTSTSLAPNRFTPSLPPRLIALNLPAPTNLRFENNLMWGSVTHLAWDWSGAGSYTEGTLTGYHIVATANGSPWREWDVNTASTKDIPFSPPEGYCGNTYSFSVTAVQDDQSSPASAPVEYSSQDCVLRHVQVIFESLALGPDPATGRIFDSGDLCIICRDNEFELQGSFEVHFGPYDNYYSYLRWSGTSGRYEDLTVLPVPFVYDLSYQPLFQYPETPRTNNNSVEVTFYATNPVLHIRADIWDTDYPGWSYEDCQINIYSTHSSADWPTVDETLTMSSEPGFVGRPGEQIGCRLTVRLIGIPTP